MKHTTLLNSDNRADVEQLRRFEILEGLSAEQLDLLASSLTLHYARKGQRIIRRGDQDPDALFLVSGTVLLEAEDGHSRSVVADTPAGRRPLVQLSPKQYDVTAKTPVQYLLIDTHLLRDLQRQGSHQEESGLVLASDARSREELQESLLALIQTDLDHRRLVLPSLPEVAIRLARVLEQAGNNRKRVSRRLLCDPAISAKLLEAANRKAEEDSETVTTLSEAVDRLGVDDTRRRVVAYALGELYRPHSRLLVERMRAVWESSLRSAYIAYLLARLDGRFRGEQGMLAALLHDLGAIAILSYTEGLPELAADAELLEEILGALRGRVGAMILRAWGLPEAYAMAAEQADLWQRDEVEQADLVDLVIVARLHARIGHDDPANLPCLEEVPPFQRLELGEADPLRSLQIIRKAKEQMQEGLALLGL